VGSREEDIVRGLELAHAGDQARVVEIGCGDGRDAARIVEKVGWYEGIDPSEQFVKIASDKAPNGSFKVSDALAYEYPGDIDVVFAFASLLHVNRDDLKLVFSKVHDCLKPEGIFYISLKERPGYTEEVKRDQYGERMFYFYNTEEIKAIAGDLFSVEFEVHHQIAGTDWFEIALRKHTQK